jgi:hypothetical protein
VVGLALVVSSAVAVPPGGGVGVHDLVDESEYPAVRCVYGAGGDLVRLRVRAPVLFAPDTTSAEDSGPVHWFTLLEVWNGSEYVPQTPVDRGARTPTDRHPAHYPAAVIQIPHDPAAAYRVRMRFIYDPSGIPKLVQHYPNFYRVTHPTQADYTRLSDCPGQYEGLGVSVKGFTFSGHHSDGGYGVHSLVEESGDDIGGARCVYDSILRRIRVRFPVMYARDRTSGVDKQVVGYRIVIQSSDVSADGPWTTLAGSASPISTVRTSDQHIAHLPSKSYTFAPGVAENRVFWRALVRMYWYKPGSSTVVEGRADHAPRYFEGNEEILLSPDSCHGFD